MGLLSVVSVYRSLSRMYTTLFFGPDVAGETLKELTDAQERVFLFTLPQGYAIARYAHRYAGWSKDLADFKQKEKESKIRFLCIYPGDYVGLLKKDQPQLFEYIQDNYGIKEVGLQEVPPHQLGYIIMGRGACRKKDRGFPPDAFRKDSAPLHL